MARWALASAQAASCTCKLHVQLAGTERCPCTPWDQSTAGRHICTTSSKLCMRMRTRLPRPTARGQSQSAERCLMGGRGLSEAFPARQPVLWRMRSAGPLHLLSLLSRRPRAHAAARAHAGAVQLPLPSGRAVGAARPAHPQGLQGAPAARKAPARRTQKAPAPAASKRAVRSCGAGGQRSSSRS